MFDVEEGFRRRRKFEEWYYALSSYGDVPDASVLPGPSLERLKTPPQLPNTACVLDINEHFIELSGPGVDDRRPEALAGLMAAVVIGLLGVGLTVWLVSWVSAGVPKGPDAILMLGLAGGILFTFAMAALIASERRMDLFTCLRCRYRFNRDTGQVHVLRPKRYGGNVVLDWQRVKAHLQWAPVSTEEAAQERSKYLEGELTYFQRHTNHGRQADASDLISLLLGFLITLEPDVIDTSDEGRRIRRSRAPHDGHLLLVWPALDADQAEAAHNSRRPPTAQPSSREATALWLGPPGEAQAMWTYLCHYMLVGMDGVGKVKPTQWLRKGRDPQARRMMRWAERLCWWPTFPPEWHSDGGQPRRESGQGPEELVRWNASW